MIRCKFKNVDYRFVCKPLILLLLFVVELFCVCSASEFPDRECCDPIHPGFNQSTLPPTTASILPSSPVTPIGRSGKLNIHIYTKNQHTAHEKKNVADGINIRHIIYRFWVCI